MKELNTTIDIQAPAETVWKILTDFPAYADWNPFITRASGEIFPGAKLSIHITPPGRKGMTFHPTVTNVIPRQELRWLGHLFLPGLFDGEHIFLLHEKVEGFTRFEQKEKFTGILTPLLHLEKTKLGFEMMNRALKQRAETL